MTEWLALHAHDIYETGFCVVATGAVIAFFWRILCTGAEKGQTMSRLDALETTGFVHLRRETLPPDPDDVCGGMLEYHQHVDTAKGLASNALVDSDFTECTPKAYFNRRHA